MELRVSIEEKAYRRNGDTSRVLRGLEFTASAGSIVGVYGPSGCGKSTLLRIVAGLDTDYVGSVMLDGRQVAGPTRDIGLTVQNLASFDWLTVAGNIAFGLRYAHRAGSSNLLRSLLGQVDRSEADVEVARLADIVGLSASDLNKYPEEISGGMKQRMVFARALLPRPKVLLLDEPFSSLDYDSRHALQDLVLQVRSRLGTTFVCITHDPEEALYLADSILIMSRSPSTVMQRFAPALPFKGTDECRYTKEFQEAKKILHAYLT